MVMFGNFWRHLADNLLFFSDVVVFVVIAAVVVTAPHHDQQPRAQCLAAQLSASLHHPGDALPAGLSAMLIVTAERLALQPVARSG